MRESTRVPWPQAEAPQAHDESQPGNVLVPVVAISVSATLRQREHPDLLVPANCGGRDPGAARELGDLHTAPARYPRASRS